MSNAYSYDLTTEAVIHGVLENSCFESFGKI